MLFKNRRRRRSVDSSSNEDKTHDEDDDCPVLSPKSLNNTNSSPHIDLMDLLNTGYKYLEADLSSGVEEVVLFMGNSGSGKSTLVQMLAGDLSKLHAVLTQSGELVIIDEEDRIGAPTTMSKTLIPELVLLKQGNKTTALFDCPGFNDNRGPDQDIAANIFIHEILKRVKKVKILFLVIHSSVKMGNDRLDFDLLVKHVTTFLRNIPKHKAAIGLVVTKVDNFNSRGNMISDSSVMKRIVEFLEGYNTTLNEPLMQNHWSSEMEVFQRKLEFIEALLTKDENEKYEKLSFSRNPKNCGPLHNSQIVSQTKLRAYKLLNNLEYSSVDENDFGYSLRDSTMLKMKDFVKNSTDSMTDTISKVIMDFGERYMEDHLKQDEYNASSLIGNVGQSLDKIEKLCSKLENYVSLKNTSSNGLNGVVLALSTTFGQMGYRISAKVERFLRLHQKYLDFFNFISKNDVVHHNNQGWIRSLSDFSKSLINARDWYEFCEDTEKRLEAYEWQKTKPYFDTNQNGIDFLETSWKFPVSRNIKRIFAELNHSQQNVLQRILSFAAQSSTLICNMKEGHATLSGNYILLSDFFNEAGKRKSSLCIYNTQINRIEIYARRVVFIDTDINAKGEELNLVIISVKLDSVAKPRQFHLSGNDADPRNIKTDVIPDNLHGYNITPSSPGGSFFGISLDSSNMHWTYNRPALIKGGSGPFVIKIFKEKIRTFLSAILSPLNQCAGSFSGKMLYYSGNYKSIIVSDNFDREKKLGDVCEPSSRKISLHKRPKPLKYLITEWKSILNFKTLLFTSNITNPGTFLMLEYLNTDDSLGQYKNLETYSEELSLILRISPSLPLRRFNRIIKLYIASLQEFLKTKSQSLSSEQKKVSAYLLSLAYGTLEELDEEQNTYSVVDILQYFNVVKERITHFRESTALLSIKETQDNLSQNLQKKVEVTKEIQEKNIKPYLDKAKKVLDSKLISMGEQFIRLIQNAQVNVNDVKNELKKAKDSLIFDMALKGITSIVSFGSMIFTGGATAPLAIASVLPVVDIVATGITTSQPPPNIPKISYDEISSIVSNCNELADKLSDGVESFGTPISSQAALAIKTSYYFGEQVANSLSTAARTGSQIQKLEAMVEQAEMILEDIQNRNKLMHNIFIPAVQSTVSAFETVLQSMKNDRDTGSLHPSKLKLGQFKISRALKEIKENLFLIGRGLQTQDFTNALELTQDYLEMMISLFEDIEGFENTRALGDYLAVLNSAQFQQIYVQDSKLSYALTRIIQLQTKNLFMIEYRKALEALRQWVFPFGKLHLTKDLQYVNYDTAGNLADVYLEQVQRIQLELQKYKSTVLNSQDTHLILSNFSSGYVTSEPFCIWDNEKWSESITDLLSGQPAKFYANIRSSPREKDAIKFKVIEVKLNIPKHKETALKNQKELDRELRHFAVLLTHSGVSHYRFNDSFYSMYGVNKTIRYNFEVNEASGEHQGTNVVYQKFKDGDYLLSPYTSWTIQLVRVSRVENKRNSGRLSPTGFEDLKGFIPFVEIELQGKAIYVDSNGLNSNLEVDSFYKRDDSIRAEES